MTLTMPLTIMHVKAAELGGRATSVLAGGFSGWEVAGSVGGIVGVIATVTALVLSVIAGNAKRRRQYDDDRKAAKEEGREEVRAALAAELAELREIRSRYFNILEARGVSLRREVSGPADPGS